MQRSILHMTLDPDLKKRLEQLAADDNRTLSNLISVILKNYVTDNNAKPRKKG